MIRANLLPRTKKTIRAFGVAVDGDYLRAALLGLALVCAVAVFGYVIERLRLDRLQLAAAQSDALLALRARERTEAKRLALDVARYQEFEREADVSRTSGADAAVTLARIGNSIPADVWFEGLERDAAGYAVSARSGSLESVGRAILSLGRALPNAGASLVTIDNREPGVAAHFSARLHAPPSAGSE